MATRDCDPRERGRPARTVSLQAGCESPPRPPTERRTGRYEVVFPKAEGENQRPFRGIEGRADGPGCARSLGGRDARAPGWSSHFFRPSRGESEVIPGVRIHAPGRVSAAFRTRSSGRSLHQSDSGCRRPGHEIPAPFRSATSPAPARFAQQLPIRNELWGRWRRRYRRFV